MHPFREDKVTRYAIDSSVVLRKDFLNGRIASLWLQNYTQSVNYLLPKQLRNLPQLLESMQRNCIETNLWLNP